MNNGSPFDQIVGISYEATPFSNAFSLFWKSYSELKIVTDLAVHLINTALSVDIITSKTFRKLKDDIRSGYEGEYSSTELLYHIVDGDAISQEEALKILDNLSLKDFLKSVKELYNEAAAKSIITGNLNRQQVEISHISF